jgi:DNA-binding transcriptional MerR regulator
MRSRVDTYLVPTVPNPKRPLRSGDLGRATGVSTDTLRHYERLGILKKPPRTQGGYRLYPPESFNRVLLVRNALASGFTLKELVEVLRVRDAGGAPCRQVAQLAHEKVRQLDLQIAQLTQLRDSLKVTVREWDRRLEKGPPNDRAHLLESLSPKQKKQTINPAGDGNEDTRARRVNGSSGLSPRSKRNVLPHARTAPAGI